MSDEDSDEDPRFKEVIDAVLRSVATLLLLLPSSHRRCTEWARRKSWLAAHLQSILTPRWPRRTAQ